MNRILVTGASGFVGTHLIDHLLSVGGYEIFGTVYGSGQNYLDDKIPKDHLFAVNLLDEVEVRTMVETIKPTKVVHLAALSSPAKSNQNPIETLTNNIGAQVNLFESLRMLDPMPRTLVIGSAEEYGLVVKDGAINESTPLNPVNPYAVSKIAQDYLGLQYFNAYGLPVIRLRSFNHTGERHAPTFVMPAFAKQIAEIEIGKKTELIVEGDLEVWRDFTDVKDVVAGYVVALENCQPGEVYNIGSGKSFTIKSILEMMISKATVPIKVIINNEKQGKSTIKNLTCDYQKFESATGWIPKIPLDQTIDRILTYWRQVVKQGEI